MSRADDQKTLEEAADGLWAALKEFRDTGQWYSWHEAFRPLTKKAEEAMDHYERCRGSAND